MAAKKKKKPTRKPAARSRTKLRGSTVTPGSPARPGGPPKRTKGEGIVAWMKRFEAYRKQKRKLAKRKRKRPTS